jgi:arylsulfatase A-like enzyme
MRVLLVDIDSLRPDHLGCYGYERPVSPTIDRLAADGVRFTECFASDTPCLPSRTALATCRFEARTGVVTHFGSGQWFDYEDRGHSFDEDRPLAFRLLSRNGVRTATVSSFGDHHSAYHFPGSFTDAIQPTPDTTTETCADVTRAATRWLGEHGTADDWLLHVQYWGVHHPYEEIGGCTSGCSIPACSRSRRCSTQSLSGCGRSRDPYRPGSRRGESDCRVGQPV